MEKEFIPYGQALALKELGFDELCICIYNREKSLRANVFNNPNDRFKSVQLSYNSGKIPAPLYQQAFRWFREKHNLYSTIVLISNSPKDRAYIPMIDYIYPHKAIMDFVEYETHEEAELECLKKLIEIVKEIT